MEIVLNVWTVRVSSSPPLQVIEESPSCLLTPETRLAMQEQAVMLSKATGYRCSLAIVTSRRNSPHRRLLESSFYVLHPTHDNIIFSPLSPTFAADAPHIFTCFIVLTFCGQPLLVGCDSVVFPFALESSNLNASKEFQVYIRGVFGSVQHKHIVCRKNINQVETYWQV